MMIFFAGFAIVGAERSLAHISNFRRRWFDTAQYHPRPQRAVDAALTILRGFILGAFGAYWIVTMTYAVLQATLLLLGGVTGWFAVQRYGTTFDQSIDSVQPEAITPR
jgi:hypothetical protein